MNFINKIDKDITLLLDNLPVGIIRFNDKHKCIYANRFVINLLGLDPSRSDTDISKTYLNAIHNEDRESEINTCITFMETHRESHSTFRIFNKQTNEYTWMTNKRNIVYSDNTISFMFTLQDVNENKLLEIQLRNETIRAEKAYNHKSIFLANMSHEIRTPLNGIIGMLTLLEDTTLTNDQKDYISMVKECSFNLMTIINDILDYSKLEVGKISLDIRPMNIRECIETTNDIVLSKIYEKSLEYSYNIDQNIPEYIYGDSNRIKQVLLNLLSNSIKFTEIGNIIVHINTISEKDFMIIQNKNSHISKEIMDKALQKDKNIFKNKLFLRFDIFDSGCGINSDETDKLFKSFSQVDNQITSKIYQGTGLGLAISKELVELMDGTIWLDWSEANKGSKFSFILPTLECVNEESNTTKSNNVLNNANVLIIDDNIHNRISLTGMVTKWGMKPQVFSNGEEALHFTKLIRFDIGLIDICMPKMDGHTFAKKLREQTEFKNKEFPLVALSSLGDKLTSNDKHFKTHLIKPIKESRLKNICIDLLQTRKTEPEKQQMTTNMLDQYINQNNICELKSNVRILLAEDVYINQKVVTSFLNKLGYDNIKVVDNGQQCLDIAINNDFDVILLDIRMPIMNGEVVLQKLHEYYNKESKIKPFIVAVTAYCLREDKQRYLDMGFDDYIPKPITLNELKRCLDKFIQNVLSK
jgi:signal transduction histidine kinase/DNA-binding response OmpR family regulator